MGVALDRAAEFSVDVLEPVGCHGWETRRLVARDLGRDQRLIEESFNLVLVPVRDFERPSRGLLAEQGHAVLQVFEALDLHDEFRFHHIDGAAPSHEEGNAVRQAEERSASDPRPTASVANYR
jgi:hypothetical protein